MQRSIAHPSPPTSINCVKRGKRSCFWPSMARLRAMWVWPTPIKATTAEAVRLLKASGVKVLMLTGDNPVTANAVATKLALDGVKAGVLPQDKYKYVLELQQQGHIVAMAG